MKGTFISDLHMRLVMVYMRNQCDMVKVEGSLNPGTESIKSVSQWIMFACCAYKIDLDNSETCHWPAWGTDHLNIIDNILNTSLLILMLKYGLHHKVRKI